MLTTTDIRQFLLPRRIALIGASDSSRFARAIVETNRQLGFSGKLYFINPNQTSVMGAACHPNLDALPERVDSAVICVPRMHVRGQIEDCIRAGVKGAVLHTAGYAEADGDGAEAQADLVSLCRAHGFGMLGPNCLGSFSNAGKVSLYGGPLPADLPCGGISVVAQSGSAAIALMNSGRGLGFNYIASTGNEAVVTTEADRAFHRRRCHPRRRRIRGIVPRSRCARARGRQGPPGLEADHRAQGGPDESRGARRHEPHRRHGRLGRSP